MKRFGLMRLWVFCGLTALCLAAAPVLAQMNDLGTLGGNNSVATCINSAGQVAGHAQTAAGTYKGFKFENGMLQALEGATGDSYANGINLQGFIVGFAQFDFGGQLQAFIYSGEQMYGLGFLAGGQTSSAFGINFDNMIVGGSSTAGGSDNGFRYHYTGENNLEGGGKESGGTMQGLGTLGGDNSSARGINNLNQIVGEAQNAAGQFRAFLYTGAPGVDGVMHDLGTLGGTESWANGINNLGQIVGYSKTAGGQRHAFLYTGIPGIDGVMHDLGTLGGTNSWAMAINDRGQIVGYSHTAGGQTHAFLYTGVPGAGGAMRDLGTFPGGTKSWAYGINNNGQIVGKATTAAGTSHAFLYTPPPGAGPALLLLLSEWLRPLTGWGHPPNLALPPEAGLGGTVGRFKRG